MQGACLLLLALLNSYELLALSSHSPAAPVGKFRGVQRFPLSPALRGGCDGEHGGQDTAKGGGEGAGPSMDDVTDGGLLADEMQKASELLKRVNVELGETEALVEQKQEVDANYRELQDESEKARLELSKRTAALLLAAAKSGDVPSVQEALDNGADMFADDEDGMNAIHHAAAGGHTEVISLLVARDASALSTTATDGSNALHLASYYGSQEAVELLLELNSCVNAQDAEG
jgi:hypothetical protein